jgi:hypothetical protein
VYLNLFGRGMQSLWNLLRGALAIKFWEPLCLGDAEKEKNAGDLAGNGSLLSLLFHTNRKSEVEVMFHFFRIWRSAVPIRVIMEEHVKTWSEVMSVNVFPASLVITARSTLMNVNLPSVLKTQNVSMGLEHTSVSANQVFQVCYSFNS